MFGFFRRSARFVSQHGAAGALVLLTRRLGSSLLGCAELPDAAGAEFDRKYGVDTAASQEELIRDAAAVASPNWRHGFKYQGARVELMAILDSLPLKHEEFTFIDLGSGKGRVLFHAANHAFLRIVGVEYSRRLHDIAAANIVKYSNPARRCASIESVCLDAAAYEFPPEPTVLFLFNPFDRPVMERVAVNLAASLGRHPRAFQILYCNASHAGVLLEAGFREKARWSKPYTTVLLEWPGAAGQRRPVSR